MGSGTLIRVRNAAIALVFVLLVSASGCAQKRVIAARTPPPAPSPIEIQPSVTPPAPGAPAKFFEAGVASWYGVPYHGRRAANGEVYDMYKLTAAHRTLPFDTIVRVTNLKNGHKTEVRINDRGPFVDGRVIDLSLAAAREIDMVADGVAKVRLELVSGSHPLDGLFTVQAGSFRERANAEEFRQRLATRYGSASIHEFDSPRGMFYRVFVGRVNSQDEARTLADRLRRDEGVSSPLILRIDG